MTNDYQLFPEAPDGDTTVDSDTGLVMAYLARELTPAQIAAVEERMATDAEFREAAWPMIEAWCLPGPLATGEPAAASTHPARTDRRARESVGPMRSIARVAAIIAVTVVPMFALAQVVKYIANHPGTPGHGLVQSFVPVSWRTPAQHPNVAPLSVHTEAGDLAPFVELPLQETIPRGSQQAAQVVPVIDLPPATVRTTKPLQSILGLKHTAEGRLIVNDPLRRQLLLFESDLARSTAVLDSVPGTSRSYPAANPNPNNAATWRTLSPFVGDSALFGPIPGTNVNTVLVLDGQGNVARAIAVSSTSLYGGLPLRNTYWDQVGRPVYLSGSPRGMNMYLAVYRGRWWGSGYASGSLTTRSDTLTIVRVVDLTTGRADTVGAIKLPENVAPSPNGPVGVQHAGSGGGKRVPVPGPNGVCWFVGGVRPADDCPTTAKQVINPLYFVDDWAMLSDGTIAFVRGEDYHIDWIHPDGTKSASAKLPFDRKRLTEADKQALVDSTRAINDSLDAVAEVMNKQYEPWRDSVRIAGMAAGKRMFPGHTDFIHPGPPVRVWPYEIVPLSEIADYYPPIRPAASKPDADGNLWILPRMTSLSRQGELVYDVVNPTRGLAQRVRLPVGRSIAGFGKGGIVYLQYGDLKNGFILERSTLPAPIPK